MSEFDTYGDDEWGEVVKAQEAADGGFDTYDKELNLIAGERVLVRPIFQKGQPYKYDAHGMSEVQGRGFEKIRCSVTQPGVGMCWGCVAAAQSRTRQRMVNGVPVTETVKEDRCRKKSPRAALCLFSTRMLVKIGVPKRDGSGVYMRWEPVRFDAEGYPIVKDRNTSQVVRYPGFGKGQHPLLAPQYTERMIEGVRAWDGSATTKAQNISKINDLRVKLRELCQCGQKVGSGASIEAARVTLAGYQCRHCGQQIGYNSSVGVAAVQCASCMQTGVPKKLLVCTANCGNPRPGSMYDCYIEVTRTGAGKENTNYTFVERPFGPPDPSHVAEALDLAALYSPTSLDAQVEMLAARGIQLQQGQPAAGGQQQVPQVGGSSPFAMAQQNMVPAGGGAPPPPPMPGPGPSIPQAAGGAFPHPAPAPAAPPAPTPGIQPQTAPAPLLPQVGAAPPTPAAPAPMPPAVPVPVVQPGSFMSPPPAPAAAPAPAVTPGEWMGDLDDLF